MSTTELTDKNKLKLEKKDKRKKRRQAGKDKKAEIKKEQELIEEAAKQEQEQEKFSDGSVETAAEENIVLNFVEDEKKEKPAGEEKTEENAENTENAIEDAHENTDVQETQTETIKDSEDKTEVKSVIEEPAIDDDTDGFEEFSSDDEINLTSAGDLPGESTDGEIRVKEFPSLFLYRKVAVEAEKVYIRKTRRYKKAAVAAGIAAGAASIALIIGFGIIPAVKYANAEKLYSAGEISAAVEQYSEIRNFRKSSAKMQEIADAAAQEYFMNDDYINASIMYLRGGNTVKAEETFDFNSIVMGSSYISAGLSRTGKIYYLTNRTNDDVAKGINDLAPMVAFLPRATGVNGLDPAGGIISHTIDNSSGISISTDLKNKLYALKNVKDVISGTNAAESYQYVVILFNDGSVEVIAENRGLFPGHSKLKNIKTIVPGRNKFFAIDNRGRVIVLYEEFMPEEQRYDVSEFRNIKKVVETGKCLIGLTGDGKIVASYRDTEKKYRFSFGNAKNVRDIAANGDILLILKSNGHVEGTEIPAWIGSSDSRKLKFVNSVLRKTGTWSNIARIRFADGGIYGIKNSGEVEYVSCDISFDVNKDRYVIDRNSDILSQVKTWTGVVDVIDCKSHAIAVRENGTAYCAGDGTYMRKVTPNSASYMKVKDGMFINVSDWLLWENDEDSEFYIDPQSLEQTTAEEETVEEETFEEVILSEIPAEETETEEA